MIVQRLLESLSSVPKHVCNVVDNELTRMEQDCVFPE